jgi:hypothetical protein
MLFQSQSPRLHLPPSFLPSFLPSYIPSPTIPGGASPISEKRPGSSRNALTWSREFTNAARTPPFPRKSKTLVESERYSMHWRKLDGRGRTISWDSISSRGRPFINCRCISERSVSVRSRINNGISYRTLKVIQATIQDEDLSNRPGLSRRVVPC